MRDSPARRARVLAGLLAASALWLALAAYRRDPGLNVPPLVAYIAASVFGLTALAVVAQALGRPRLTTGFAGLVMVGLATVGGWIALGPGVRNCRGGIGGQAFPVSAFGCRAVFGIGAICTTLMAVWALRQWVHAKRS